MAVLATYKIVVMMFAIPIVYTSCKEACDVAKSNDVMCRRPVAVHVPTSAENDTRNIFPISVKVKRCVGKFGKTICVAKKTTKKVFKVTINGSCGQVKIEHHTECQFSNQPIQSTVLSKEDIKRKECKANKKKWNRKEQRCVCKKKCTTDQYLDDKCNCLLKN